MRRDDPPHLFALDCPTGGAMVVCETQRHVCFGGRDNFWARTPKGIQPFSSFEEANGQVKHLREEQADYFGRRG